MIKQDQDKSSFEPWSFKKSGILSKYTTVEKLTITSSFLTPIAGAVKDKGIYTQIKLFKLEYKSKYVFLINSSNYQQKSNYGFR